MTTDHRHPLDVILVSRKRYDFLAVTLSSLAGQGEPLHLHLAFHEDTLPTHYPYVLRQTMELFRRVNPKNKISIHHYPEVMSLAAVRADLVRNEVKSPWFLMMDNDTWCSPGLVSNLLRGARHYSSEDIRLIPVRGDVVGTEYSEILAVCYPHVDVDDSRGYADYSTEVYPTLEDYYSKTLAYGPQFSLCREGGGISFSATHALWNLDAVHNSGILKLWDKYPVGVRGYDLIGTAHASLAGYLCILLPSVPSGPDDNKITAFWHLWTLPNDTGFFDVSPRFGTDGSEVVFADEKL